MSISQIKYSAGSNWDVQSISFEAYGILLKRWKRSQQGVKITLETAFAIVISHPLLCYVHRKYPLSLFQSSSFLSLSLSLAVSFYFSLSLFFSDFFYNFMLHIVNIIKLGCFVWCLPSTHIRQNKAFVHQQDCNNS